MGLPLFVEPTNSASSSKSTTKDGESSSSHAESRNALSRSEIRDRRNGIRRAGVRFYGPMQRNTRNSRERFLPWVESPREQEQAASSATDRRSGMLREVLREMTGRDDRRREIDERMTSLFATSWRGSPPPHPLPPPLPPPGPAVGDPDNMSEGVDLGWWSVEPSLPQSLQLRPEQHQANYAAISAESPQRTVPSLFGRPLPSSVSEPPTLRVVAAHRGQAPTRYRYWAMNYPRPSRNLSSRSQVPSRRTFRGVDGLGDRDRSLSPEVWDTLLSTLTPDPQTPSVGSSFASVAASQTAGSLSETPITAPDMANEVQTEGVCESECEFSDNEITTDYEHLDHARVSRRRQGLGNGASRDTASRILDYNLDGMSEPYLGNMGSMASESFSTVPVHTSRRPRSPGGGRMTRQNNASNGSLPIFESTTRLSSLGDSSEPLSRRPTRELITNESLLAPQLSDAIQDADGHTYRPQQIQETQPLASIAGPLPSEDDWTVGMQRIIRSLARREDIPDGWWAEAGLSRILGQSGNSST